jgi:hypothetical protein
MRYAFDLVTIGMLAVLGPLAVGIVVSGLGLEPADGVAIGVLLLPFGMLYGAWLVEWFRTLRGLARRGRGFWSLSLLVSGIYCGLFLLPTAALPYGILLDHQSGFDPGAMKVPHLLDVGYAVVRANLGPAAVVMCLAMGLSLARLAAATCRTNSSLP